MLLLTAAAGIRDRVEGLGLGADDYLTKPFAFAELVARVQALARRSAPALPPVLEQDGMVLDVARHAASRDGLRARAEPEGVRRAARADARRRPGGQRRGAAGAGLGRVRRPVHQRGTGRP